MMSPIIYEYTIKLLASSMCLVITQLQKCITYFQRLNVDKTIGLCGVVYGLIMIIVHFFASLSQLQYFAQKKSKDMSLTLISYFIHSHGTQIQCLQMALFAGSTSFQQAF
jgi:hypothetical protein